jgi:hypothetical protein
LYFAKNFADIFWCKITMTYLYFISNCVWYLGDPEEKETEDITRLWQSSLFNANYEMQRYCVHVFIIFPVQMHSTELVFALQVANVHGFI